MGSSNSNACNIRTPLVLWAQRKDRVFVSIQLDNCVKPTVEIKDGSLYFKGKGGPNQIDHEVKLEFNKEINPKESRHRTGGREIFFDLLKKDDSMGFWPRLLKDSKKPHYLKTDFTRWKDEDDSDVEEQENFNLDDMMSSMGGMPGGMPGMGGEDEEDSDDEELPDLQQ